MNYFQLIKYGDAVISKVDSKLLYCLSQFVPFLFLFLIENLELQEQIIEKVQSTLINISQSIIFSIGIILYLLIVLVYFISFRNFQMSKERFISKKELIFIQYFTLIQEQINQILKFPILLIIGIHINQSLDLYSFPLICDFVMILIQFTISLAYIILTTPILNLRKKSFKLLHLEILSGFIGYLITVAIAICTGYTIGEQNTILKQKLIKVVSALNIVNSIIIFYSILITQIYQNISQIKIALAIHSFSLLYAIQIAFNLKFQNAMTILVSILIFQISNKFILSIFQKIILKPTKMLKQAELSQSIFQKFNLQLATQELLIYKAYLLAAHRINCENIECSCMQNLYLNDIRVILKDDVYLDQRIRHLKSIQRDYSNLDISTFCHFISAFYICQDYISISIFICKNKILENLNILRIDLQVKWEVFYYLMKQEIFKQSMQHVNSEYTENQQRFTNMVQKFFRNKFLFREVKKLSLEIIENKLSLLNEILSPNISKYYELYEKKLKIITKNLQKMEKYISQKQDQNSDPKFNQLLLFVYGNVLNNWQLAQQGKKKLSAIIKTHQLTFGSKDFNLQYIIFNYDLLLVTFNKYSQGIPAIFGYTNEQFKQLKYLEEITPKLIGQIHMNLIQKFFKTGKSNYFRKRNSIICKQADGKLKLIQLSFDVEQLADSIQIITYIIPQVQQDSVIIVNNDGIIMNYSQEFHDMINFQHGHSWDLNNLRCKSRNNEEYYIYFQSQHLRSQEYILNCECLIRETYKIIYIFSMNNYSHSSTYKLTNKDDVCEEDDVIQKPYDEYQMIETQIKIDLHQVVQRQQLIDIEQQINVSESQIMEDQLISYISTENINFDSEKNKKSSMLNQLVKQNKTGINIINLVRIILLAVTCQICYIIIVCIKQIIQGISNMLSDIRISSYYYEYVQIDHYIIEPMQKFVLAKLTILNYHVLQDQAYFTQEEYQFYSSFANENVLKQYFILKNNFEMYFADKQLQEYIFSDQILIKQQIVHHKPVQVQEKEASINVAFSILLEGFYEQYLLYAQDKRVSSSSPFQTYEIVNSLTFIRYFEELSDIFFQDAIIKIEIIVQRLITLLIIINCLFILFAIFMAAYQLRNKRSIEKFMNLRRFINPVNIKQEMDALLGYKLKVLNQNQINVQYPCQSEQKQVKNTFLFKTSLKNIYIPYIKMLLFLLLIQTYLFGFTYFLTMKSISYLNTFPNSITLLKLISDVNVHLPSTYAQIEMLYNWSKYSYLTDEDYQGYLEEFEETIFKLDRFMNLQMSKDKTQFSKQELDYFDLLLSGNLCEILDENEYVNFNYFCTKSYNGLLQFGTLQTIAYLTDQIELEIENNFTTRSAPILQLEAVYLCADAVTLLTDSMHRDILNEEQKYKYYILIVGIIGIASGILLIVVVWHIQHKFNDQLQRAKLFFYIFPQGTLYGNDALERELRLIMKIEKLY